MSAAEMTAKNLNRFPPQIKYIVGNEAAERFSYYGMRSILVIFMTQYLVIQENTASSTYHTFIAACYLLPLLGAFISDRFLGKYRTIMLLSLVYCAGHGVLAIWETESGMYWGLALIALGAGGIKPCVSAHVGDQFTEKNKHLLERIFSIFYFSINLGAFLSSLLIPLVLIKWGPGVAFGIPGILMAIATVVFWMGRKYYVHVPPQPSIFGPILRFAVSNRKQKAPGEGFLDVAKRKFSENDVEGAKSVIAVGSLFLLVSAFWALFDQTGSTWVLQAEKMQHQVLGMTVSSAQMQALNPIFVLTLIPLFSIWIYPFFQKRGLLSNPLKKMTAGMLIAGTSFVATAFIEYALEAGQAVNIAWQAVPYLLITIAEIMVSITGLEFAYTQAPRSMKSTVMSFWLLTVFVGNLFTAVITEINVFDGGAFYLFFAGLMGVVAVIFAVAASRYRIRDFMESESELEREKELAEEASLGAMTPALSSGTPSKVPGTS